MKKNILLIAMALIGLNAPPVSAITMEVHHISNNGPAASAEFGSMSASTIFAQAQQYLVVRY